MAEKTGGWKKEGRTRTAASETRGATGGKERRESVYHVCGKGSKERQRETRRKPDAFSPGKADVAPPCLPARVHIPALCLGQGDTRSARPLHGVIQGRSQRSRHWALTEGREMCCKDTCHLPLPVTKLIAPSGSIHPDDKPRYGGQAIS